MPYPDLIPSLSGQNLVVLCPYSVLIPTLSRPYPNLIPSLSQPYLVLIPSLSRPYLLKKLTNYQTLLFENIIHCAGNDQGGVFLEKLFVGDYLCLNVSF